jgi:hypothetical protein
VSFMIVIFFIVQANGFVNFRFYSKPVFYQAIESDSS